MWLQMARVKMLERFSGCVIFPFFPGFKLPIIQIFKFFKKVWKSPFLLHQATLWLVKLPPPNVPRPQSNPSQKLSPYDQGLWKPIGFPKNKAFYSHDPCWWGCNKALIWKPCFWRAGYVAQGGRWTRLETTGSFHEAYWRCEFEWHQQRRAEEGEFLDCALTCVRRLWEDQNDGGEIWRGWNLFVYWSRYITYCKAQVFWRGVNFFLH